MRWRRTRKTASNWASPGKSLRKNAYEYQFADEVGGKHISDIGPGNYPEVGDLIEQAGIIYTVTSIEDRTIEMTGPDGNIYRSYINEKGWPSQIRWHRDATRKVKAEIQTVKGEDEGDDFEAVFEAYLTAERTGHGAPFVDRAMRLMREYAEAWGYTVEDVRAFLQDAKFTRGATRKVAHDSGDGETIYHCLSGDTRYWTWDGLRSLEETAGTVQRVLTPAKGGPKWVDAHIHAFGEQETFAITLRRNKTRRVIRATGGHRWFVDGRELTTDDLKVGMTLDAVIPKSRLGASNPSQFGIAHGIVYGDGTRADKGSVVRLWGEKDAQLLRYFSESVTYPEVTASGVKGQRVVNLPAYFKRLPSENESVPYLYGFLAGWFAADGSVDGSRAVLTSANLGDLEWVQWIATTRLGIATYGIYEKDRVGYGDEASPLYSLSFVTSTLPEGFFLVEEHQGKVGSKAYERVRWTIDSIEPYGVEPVYCAVVPETESFTLDGMIHTGNCPFCGAGQVVGNSDGTAQCQFCDTTFTVQVQPSMPGVPQTIDGEPHVHPEMPGSVPGEYEEDPEPEEGTEILELEEDEKDGSMDNATENPFTKQEKRYRVGNVSLSEEDFMRRLAILHADDRTQVIKAVRKSREG